MRQLCSPERPQFCKYKFSRMVEMRNMRPKLSITSNWHVKFANFQVFSNWHSLVYVGIRVHWPLAINHLGDSGMANHRSAISPAGAEHTNIRVRQFRTPAQASKPTIKPPWREINLVNPLIHTVSSQDFCSFHFLPFFLSKIVQLKFFLWNRNLHY